MIPDSPDQILIKSIEKRLVTERILDKPEIESIVKAISNGSIRVEDWKFQIENSLQRRQRNASSESD